jgi:hypothetical protein
MNKETLEEAAKKRVPTSASVWDLTETRRNDFIAGAKWQQEKMYSAEDVLFAFVHGGTKFEENKDANKLSENFKELISLLNKIK